MGRTWWVTAVFFFGGLAPVLQGQQTGAPEVLSLRQAMDDAVASHPLLQAGDARLAVAEGLRVQAGLKPNPRLVIQAENLRAWQTPPANVPLHDTDDYLYGAQIIERGGKRERRIDYATAGIARAASDRQLTQAQIRGRVAGAYWTAAAAQKIADLYREDLTAFDQVVEFNRARVREGSTAGIDLLRVEIERERLSAIFRRTQQDADAARIALLREMGRREYPAIRFSDEIEKYAEAAPIALEQALKQRRDIQAGEAALQLTVRGVDLQKAYGKTDPEVQFGYKRTAGLDTLYAAVSVPLAVRNRNEGNIAAAEAEEKVARSTLEALRLQAAAEYEAARVDYASKREAFLQTVSPLRNRTDEVARIALQAYREGGVDLLRYLDAERIRIETDVLYYRSLADLQQSIVTLRLAEGEEL
jgi:cobalt-zinc-cadmium efflux system outer membrane protein